MYMRGYFLIYLRGDELNAHNSGPGGINK
jgi:hypothetical protein